MKALVFVDHPDRVPLTADSGLAGVQVQSDQLPMLRSAAFRRTVSPYLGNPISLLRLNELSRDIVRYYRRNNQPIMGA